MSKSENIDLKNDPCACPFCDEPICPDPADERYKCKGNDQLKIHLLDCVGLYCPVPVMTARDEIDRLEKGNMLEVVADDPASEEDIPRWAKRAGHKMLAMRRKDGELHFLIQKGTGEES